MMYTHGLPYRSLSLLSVDEDQVNHALDFFRQTFTTLGTMERAALESSTVAGFLRSVRFPKEHWSRELLIRLAEVQFQRVPSEVREDVKNFCNGPHSTLVNENMFRDVRDYTRFIKSNKVGGAGIWHRAVRGNIAAEHGLPVAETTKQGIAIAAPTIPSAVFEANRKIDKFSLGETGMKVIQEKILRGPIYLQRT